MQKLRILAVTFSEPIRRQELSCFRGAVAEKVGLEQEWYHNHNNATDSKSDYHYRYPLIQYQWYKRCPRVLFIEDAVSEATHFFGQSNWELTLSKRPYRGKVEELQARELQLGLSSEMHSYRLNHWLALNERNFAQYQKAERFTERILMLERILAGHVLSMAKGLGYHFPERFELYIKDFLPPQRVSYKGVSLVAFEIDFRINAHLPIGLALGKGGSLGYGRISAIPKNSKR